MSGTAITATGRLRVLRAVAQGRRRYVLTAALLAIVAAGCTVALPLAVRELVNGLTRSGAMLPATVALAAFALFGALCSGGSAALLGHATEAMVRDLRRDLTEHALRLPVPTIRRHGGGDLLARIIADVATLRAIVELGVVQFPAAVLQATLTLVVMALLDPVLLGITLACFLLAGGTVAAMLVGIRRHAAVQQTTVGRLATDLQAALASVVTIKAARAENQAVRTVDDSAEKAMKAAQSLSALQAAISPVMQLGQQIAMIGVVIGSGFRLGSGALDIADFAAFLLALLQLVGPLTLIGTGVGRLQAGLTARLRIEGLLHLPAEGGGTLSALGRDRPVALELAGAGVDHADGEPALHDISFTAPRTGLVAVVGPSGSGKTTLLHAVDRLTLPHTGAIRLHGTDLADWDLAALRTRVSLVDQDCTLVRGSVRDNLVLGHPGEVGEHRIAEVLEQVGLSAEIDALPAGLATELGSGVELSGGQRQRLAIGRALLRRSDVVLLDEPTSALDGGNEQLLRQALRTLATTACVVVVAHRLSTVHDADRIVVLRAGTVQDVGTHDELAGRCAVYRDLLAGQLLSDRATKKLDILL